MALARKFKLFLLAVIAIAILVIYFVTSEKGYEACHNSGVCSVPVRLCDKCSQYLFNELYKVKPKEDVCRKAFMTVVIVTHPGNVERRRILRPYLRNPDIFGGKQINYVFVSGTSSAGVETNALKKESDSQGDIMQFSFIDIHHNAALLSTLIFNHIVERCSSLKENGVDFVLKIEDDSYINIAKLVKTLETFSPNKNFVGGQCQVKKVERNINDLTFVGEEIYPLEYFPVSCAKHAYVISYKGLADIIKMAPNLPSVHLEEVFITGLCRAAAHVDYVNLGGFDWPNEPSECDLQSKVIAKELVPEEYQGKLLQRLMEDNHVSFRCWLSSGKTVVIISIVIFALLVILWKWRADIFCRYLHRNQQDIYRKI